MTGTIWHKRGRGGWSLAPVLFLAVALAAPGAVAQTKTTDAPPGKGGVSQPAEAPPQAEAPTGEAAARKAASEALLRSRGIAVLDSLPTLPPEAATLRRSVDEVTRRAVALIVVSVKAEVSASAAQELVDLYHARDWLSPAERAFLDNPAPEQQDVWNMSWRSEGARVLFWALGFVDEIGADDQLASTETMQRALTAYGPEALFASAELRPQSEILDAADYTYRLDWAVVEAQQNGDDPPPGVNGDITYERHYALNWLYGYQGLAWDDITTDT